LNFFLILDIKSLLSLAQLYVATKIPFISPDKGGTSPARY